ncbi:MAG: DUF455 family protein [Sandaracinaceae bacterium]|nr:DUF455 family protein [Sandaracinaceae bacterium]
MHVTSLSPGLEMHNENKKDNGAPLEAIPPLGTIERWAYDYLQTPSIELRMSPPPLPNKWEEKPVARAWVRPLRPPSLRFTHRSKTPKAKTLSQPSQRAKLLHTFFHHELQAGELFAWAVLAFPEAPLPVRRGWIRLLFDEAKHMRMYAAHIERLGHKIGDFPVRDWFWERVPACPSATSFLALMGVGLEGGNLDHGPRFAAMLEAAGDPEAGAILRQVIADEVAHVRFAVEWLERLGVRLESLANFQALLPPPISPVLLRGLPLNREARTQAGLSGKWLDELEACRLESRPKPTRNEEATECPN